MANEPIIPAAPPPAVPPEQQQEQQPDGAVNFAPESAADYQLPALNDAGVETLVRENAFNFGLSPAEVSVVAESLVDATSETLTEQACDVELGRMWGSPLEIENRMNVIAEAFAGDMTPALKDFLDRSGLGNSPQLIAILYQAAQRRLGVYR